MVRLIQIVSVALGGRIDVAGEITASGGVGVLFVQLLVRLGQRYGVLHGLDDAHLFVGFPEVGNAGARSTAGAVNLERASKVLPETVLGPVAIVQRTKNVRAHLLMTHIHWDHIIGFPFFAPLYQKGTKIMVDGCARALNGLRNIFNNQYVDGTFPVGFDDIMASIEPNDTLQKGTSILDDVRIDATELQHPQGGMGFRFREREKVLIFLTDNELREDAWPGRTRSDFIHF